MTEEQIDKIVSYSKGTITENQLIQEEGEFATSLLIHYLNDKNSSNLRQLIVCESVGLKSSPKKLGYDGDGTFDEVKPKNIDSSTNKKLDAGGNYTDITWKRHKKYIEDNSIIHIGGFIDGRLMYILRVPYRDLSKHFESILEKKLPNGDMPNRYIRSAQFNFKHLKSCPNLTIEFIRNDIDLYRSKIHKGLYNYIKEK